MKSEMRSHLKRSGGYCLLVLVVFWLGFRLMCEFWPVPVFLMKERVLSTEEIAATAKTWKIDEEHVSRTMLVATAWRDVKEKPVSSTELMCIRAKFAWGWNGYLPERIDVLDSNTVRVHVVTSRHIESTFRMVKRAGKWRNDGSYGQAYGRDDLMNRMLDWWERVVGK